MTIKEKERKIYPFIDWCKSVCILLIVMNHLSGEYGHIQYMKSFRVPLFFFAAGFLFRLSDKDNHIGFIVDRLKRLIVPYFCFYSLYMAYGYLPEAIAFWEFPWDEFIRHLHGGLLAIGTDDRMVAVPLWFLPCLFVVEIIYDWMARRFESVSELLGVVLGLSILGYALYFYHLPRLPWNLDVALMAVPFYAVGHLARNHMPEQSHMSRFWRVLLAIFFFYLNYLGSSLNPGVDMNGRFYGDYLLFFMNGFSGIIGMVLMTSALPTLNTIRFIGRNTMTVLGLHGFAILVVIRLLSRLLGYSLWARINEEPTGLLVSMSVLLLLIPVMWALERWLPWIVGKKKRRGSLKRSFVYCNLEPEGMTSGNRGDVVG